MQYIYTYIEQITHMIHRYPMYVPYAILIILLMLIVWAVHEKGI